MPRPIRCRQIGELPMFRSFSPDDVEADSNVTMTVDEYEVLRLLDHRGLTQEECASRMNVSRTTVTVIYESARKKTADMLVNGRRLLIIGGNYHFPPADIPQEIKIKGDNIMRIAVTYENGQIFQHFGKTEQFKLYDTADGKVINAQVVGTNGAGHGALAGFLKNAQADVLICGGIGGGAQMALREAGITLYGGNTGGADEAVKAFLAQTLVQNENPTCDHHGHEHGEDHSCGSHGEDRSCGSHGCGKR